jgi:hypothetical protein
MGKSSLVFILTLDGKSTKLCGGERGKRAIEGSERRACNSGNID